MVNPSARDEANWVQSRWSKRLSGFFIFFPEGGIYAYRRRASRRPGRGFRDGVTMLFIAGSTGKTGGIQMKGVAMKASGKNGPAKTASWFDPFTRWMLIIMFALLAAIFIAAKFMDMHGMKGGGTDDAVNAMAFLAAQAGKKPHPFVYLPGDAQLGAFSVANFFAGLIVGHGWKKLFEKEKE